MRSPRRGRKQVDLEPGREHADARRHEAERSVARRGIGDGRKRTRVHEAVLPRHG
jgi:hypothetical protein